MEELKIRFDALNKEQKIEFMKQIMPEMCREFGDNPTQIMNELMPICQDMMKNCNMDRMKMMSMMQK